jgi:hypothetical protein
MNLGRCKYCRESVRLLIKKALAADAGASISPNPVECHKSPSGAHEFFVLDSDADIVEAKTGSRTQQNESNKEE